jgi:hypothetical protein
VAPFARKKGKEKVNMKKRWIVGDVLIVAAPIIMSGVGSSIWCVIPAAICLMVGFALTLDKTMAWLEQEWLYEK